MSRIWTLNVTATTALVMESLSSSNVQYAYLQPLKILDEIVVDVSKNQSELGSTDSLALTPIKEEVASKDLRSYFLGKGKLLFDEPDSLPIIWLEVQPTRNDFAMKKMKTRKHTQLTAVQSSRKEKHCRPIKRKKNIERKVPCQSCDRKFVTVDDMKIHAATHLRKKQKDCFICGRRFRHGGALCLHMRSHKFARLRK